MSKYTLIKRRKKQDAQWRRFAFYPQRVIVPNPMPEPLPPMRDRMLFIPHSDEPHNQGGVLPFRPRKNPYRD